MQIKNTMAAILAGGKSSRMGRDKALLELDGKPFIQRIAETLQQVFQRVVIISDHGEDYQFLRLPIYEDIFKSCGPLGGIHSALTHSTTKSVFIVSCDIPFLSTDVIHSILVSQVPAEATIVTAQGSVQPLCGVYKRQCLPLLEEHLRRRQFTVQRFLEDIKPALVPLRCLEGISPIANVNTLEEYTSWIEQLRAL